MVLTLLSSSEEKLTVDELAERRDRFLDRDDRRRGWLREGGEMREGFNCYAAGDAEELTRVLLQTGDDRTRFGGRDALLGHSPKAIVPRFLEALR